MLTELVEKVASLLHFIKEQGVISFTETDIPSNTNSLDMPLAEKIVQEETL